MSDQLDFLDGFERDLAEAAARRRDALRAATVKRLRERLGLRRIAIATLLAVLLGSATTAVTFAVLRASVIPGPAVRDVPPDQLPAPGTTRLSGVVVPDPDAGAPPWTLRLARSSTGLLCTTVGQLVDGRFGLVGLDGRFRTYSERIVDSCGEQERGQRPSLIGARVFDADDPAAVRTVVNGVGGPALRAVTVEVRGRRHAVAVGRGGAFADVLAGYPEDNGVEVELRYGDGHRESHPLGRSPNVVPDPEGGQAWKSSAFVVDGDRRSCVSFSLARPVGEGVTSPAACGLFDSVSHPRGFYFAVRRLAPGSDPPSRVFGGGHWGGHPPRTAVWGGAGEDVEEVEISGPGVHTRPLIAVSRTFFAVFGGDVDPAALTVRLRFRDGRVERHRGSTNLVDRRVPTR